MRITREQVIPQYWISEILSHVDFFLPVNNIIIQVDGLYHYFQNGQVRPETTLQTSLLRDQGFQVIRLCYKDWNQLNSNQEEEQYFHNLLICLPKNDK